MHKSVFAARQLRAFRTLHSEAQRLAEATGAEGLNLSTNPPRDPRRREVWRLKQLEAVAAFLETLEIPDAQPLTMEQLEAIEGVGKATAARIVDALRG
jgi:DNA uptake protein ComE-like DNA-binding protein